MAKQEQKTSPISKAPTGAQPGAAGPKADEKKEKPKRTPYRAEGAAVLEAIPADFNPRKHLPLKKADFKDEWTYFEYRAQLAEKNAASFRKQAEESKSLGSTADRVKAKRMVQMMKRMAELEAELKASGVDIDALKAAATEDVPETVAG